MNLRVTTLVEDTAGGRGLLAEHGLAFWIEVGRHKMLFDSGQGLVLAANARRLGVDLRQAEAAVISHGHYDHTGGLSAVLTLIRKCRVFAHPAALAAKYARNADGSARAIGIPPACKRAVRERADLTLTDKPVEVAAGLFLTGAVPRRTDFEDVGGPYFTDRACRRPDALEDDQSAFIETRAGTVVILGCAHAGVINTLDYIRELTGQRRIHTVLGGMHLLHAGPERMRRTMAAFCRLAPRRLLSCHCTGFAAFALLWHQFKERCAPCPVGTALEWRL